MKDENFSKYGKSFQESLCHLVLVDRPFADQMFEVLDVNFLESKYLQVFISKVFDYRKKYGVHPTTSIMKTVVRAGLNEYPEHVQIRTRDFLASILISNGAIDSQEYIKETSLDFCRKQKLKEALIQSVKLINNSSFDNVSKVINDALKLGVDSNLGYDYLLDFEKRFQKKSRNAVSTGWTVLDNLCGGGLGTGELGVVIAPTGAGKSMALAHLGAQAVLNGKTVVHYTLELSDTVVASRYDSSITKVPLNDLFSLKEKVYEEVSKLSGKLIVKEYPTRSASVGTLKAHLEKMKLMGHTPDVIIVDYADLLKPVSFSKDEKRHQLETIYEELRGISQIHACPLWTASQTNRSGLNAEVITMEAISEAFNKCFVADFIFSISRTIDDKAVNSGRIFIAKNRNGPDGMVYPIFMDTSNVTIKVFEPSSDEDLVDIRVRAKEKMKKIKDIYKEHKKEQKKNGIIK